MAQVGSSSHHLTSLFLAFFLFVFLVFGSVHFFWGSAKNKPPKSKLFLQALSWFGADVSEASAAGNHYIHVFSLVVLGVERHSGLRRILP